MHIFYLALTIAIAYVFNITNGFAVFGIFVALQYIHWRLFVDREPQL